MEGPGRPWKVLESPGMAQEALGGLERTGEALGSPVELRDVLEGHERLWEVLGSHKKWLWKQGRPGGAERWVRWVTLGRRWMRLYARLWR